MPPIRFQRTAHSRQRPRAWSGIASRIVDALNVDRVTLLRNLFLGAAALVMVRLFLVQVVHHSFYEALASGQHELVQQLQPSRGELYAKDRFAADGLALVATNRTLQHVYANPKQITDPSRTAEGIAPLLGLDVDVVKERLSKPNDLYEPLKHQVTDQEIDALKKEIEEDALTGIHWIPEETRYYPEGPITSTITGFVGLVEDVRTGQYGLEGFFEDQLAGSAGSLNTELDAFGRFIAVGEKSLVEAQDGDMLILTIDKNVQYKACMLLARAVETSQAVQGSLIVLDPESGAILAMCNAPLYDPNAYADVEDIGVFLNDAISDQYEPGSVMKPLTMAAAMNEGKVTPYSTYEDMGVVEIGGFKIRNADEKAHGVLDMTAVLEQSLNTGAIYAVQQVGNERWYEYMQQFGFGRETGVALSGENPGNISSVGKLRDIYSATSSYGQGITVTPIQLLQAFGALANDGVMMKPYIVERVVKSNGYQEETKPVEVGRPVSADTARTLAAMLVRVVDNGHSKRAAVEGYFMGGKTGTAQIPREDGVGYDASRHKDTFVGFGPVTDPQFVIVIKIDEPKNAAWSEYSAAPVYGELAQYLVNYLQIPPDRIP